MKKLHAIIICSLVVILSVFASCSKEQVTNPRSPRSSPNPLIGLTPNNYPVDSLTGREFIFNNLNLDSVDCAWVINRPDLFYFFYRPMNVFISVSESDWIAVHSCPPPTDPFFFSWTLPGILKVYIYNYTGPVIGTTASIKVQFL